MLNMATKVTHFQNVAGKDAIYVGAKGSEVQIANSTGNLYISGTALTATAAEINRVADTSARIISATAATLAITEATHDGKIITLNKADGVAVTLPAATGSGAKYKFIVGTTVTSVGYIIKVTGNDTMVGKAFVCQDGGDTVVGFEIGGTDDTLTLNGTTTGGLKGDVIEVIDIAADLYFVDLRLAATSTEATPASATVS
jgi:hypothetical protein